MESSEISDATSSLRGNLFFHIPLYNIIPISKYMFYNGTYLECRVAESSKEANSFSIAEEDQIWRMYKLVGDR